MKIDRDSNRDRETRQDILHDRGSSNLWVPLSDCGDRFSNHPLPGCFYSRAQLLRSRVFDMSEVGIRPPRSPFVNFFLLHLSSINTYLSSPETRSLAGRSQVVEGSSGRLPFFLWNIAHSEKVCSSHREKGEPPRRLP